MQTKHSNKLRGTLYTVGAALAGAGGATLLASVDAFSLAKGAVLVAVALAIFIGARKVEAKPAEPTKPEVS